MKSIYYIIVCILIYSSCPLVAQDSSRWGGHIGYSNPINEISANNFKNNITHKVIGINYMSRLSRAFSFEVGFEISLIDLEIVNDGFQIPGSTPLPRSTASATMSTLMLGMKRNYRFDDNFHLRMGVLLDYDFQRPDNDGYIYQNGLGFYLALGYDINLSDSLILNIDPILRMRSLLMFSKTPITGSSLLPATTLPSSSVDLGGRIGIAYKIF